MQDEKRYQRIKHEDKLGQVSMRIIGSAIVLMTIIVLVERHVHGFPYGVYGFAAAVILAAVSFAVGQVK